MNPLRRHGRCLALLLSLMLLLPLAAAGSHEAWVDRQVINFGESFTLSWRMQPTTTSRWIDLIPDPNDPNSAQGIDRQETKPTLREVTFSIHAVEDNGRQSEGSLWLTDTPLEGSHTFTPMTGGYLFLWGSVGEEGPFSFTVHVQGGPDEGDFRALASLSQQTAQPGDSLQASVQFIEGRQPVSQPEFVWFVQDSEGYEHEVKREIGLTSSLTVPQGIQGGVEVTGSDAAGRKATGEAFFTMGGVPPLSAQMRLDMAAVRQDQPITASYTITGGQPPYQADVLWGLTAGSDGMAMYGEVETGEGYARFSPMEPGYGTAYLQVIDAQNRHVRTPLQRFIALDEQGQQRYPQLQEGPPPQQQAATPARLNQRMATRSGPGTKYTEELGTLPQDTAIVLIESVTTNGTPWGMVEFSKNGQLYRAYTGMKRIDAHGPVAQGGEQYSEQRLSSATEVYYGPGTHYARRKATVPQGTLLRVYDEVNGLYLCDYQSGGKWVRAWFPII